MYKAEDQRKALTLELTFWSRTISKRWHVSRTNWEVAGAKKESVAGSGGVGVLGGLLRGS